MEENDDEGGVESKQEEREEVRGEVWVGFQALVVRDREDGKNQRPFGKVR